MISVSKHHIQMHTKRTSYILHAGPDGVLQNLHYGARIALAGTEPLQTKAGAGYGGDVAVQPGQAAYSNLCLEMAPVNRGDYRRAPLLATMPHGGTTSEYRYTSARVSAGYTAPAGGMPHAQGADETLCIAMAETSGLTVELYYSVFYEADVITKRMRITNRGAAPVILQRALSSQLDLPRSDFTLCTLHGAWARECHLHKRPVAPGCALFGSGTGVSGNRCNPFFFLMAQGAGETAGEVYGFNLVYSGSHEGCVEVDPYGRTRISHGIWSDGFAWDLPPGDAFITPEAVMTFSEEGAGGMSRNMHRFVNAHIVPAQWRQKPRPVLVNNWEGTYFRFDEAKLLRMAQVAANLGVELFVLDDGWFGKRNSDKAGLGDYEVNRKKLPRGLAGLARSINRFGMKFGLWFEPEMVNADSDLFRAHPDWIVQTPGYVPATGRNQYVLDLCRPEVRQYIIENVNRTLDGANIEYVKWDMNRNISDNFSPALQNQGAFMHRYVLGLYEVFDAVCRSHPGVLFEGCSSGGNRFDLGILCYMPQVWTSDDTDAYERQKIQTGTSYGYPQSTMGCHVSAVPNHQTLRKTPLETRFETAAFGVLGYELDMRHLTHIQRGDVAKQIAFYKQHRRLLQFGTFYRLKNPFEENGCRWMVVDEAQEEGLLGDFMGLLVPNTAAGPLRMAGLREDVLYEVTVRGHKVAIETFGGLVNYLLPVTLNPDGALVRTANKLYRLPTEEEQYTAYGSLLCKAGIKRMQEFSGAGYSEEMRLVQDFASRLYHVGKAPGKQP